MQNYTTQVLQPKQPQQMRINKYISANSQYSRRKADELIEQKKVSVNGKLVKELGTTIDPEKDEVMVNGHKIHQSNDLVYLALNKPAGYVSTRKDEKGRPTVMDLAPRIANLKPVGRLDFETEGLILLSNDGEFINKITHPKFECEKEYFVIVRGLVTAAEKGKLERGIKVEGRYTAPSKVHIIKVEDSKTTLTIKIHEGRNRQIRKMFAVLKHYVKYLKRIAIGETQLGALKKGSYRKLTKEEIDAYKFD